MKKLILLILCCLVCCASGFCTTQAGFSVSEDTKVVFSEGNVQYHPKKDMWRFAPNQYDIIGKANKDVSSSYNGWVDLFGWKDSKDITINDRPFSGGWRILTSREWEYLLFKRKNAINLVGLGILNNVIGLILLPDNMKVEGKIDFVSFLDENVQLAGHRFLFEQQRLLKNHYIGKQWRKLENLGAVFCPLVISTTSEEEKSNTLLGSYWTNDIDPACIGRYYAVSLSLNNIYAQESLTNKVSSAVRLVRDIDNKK